MAAQQTVSSRRREPAQFGNLTNEDLVSVAAYVSSKAGAAVAALLAFYGFGQPFWHTVVRDLVKRRSPH